MKKRDIILSIIIVAMFVLVLLYVVKISDIGRRLSELEIAQQHSWNVSFSIMCAPILPLAARANNLTDANIGQDHLQANNQPDLSIDTENITTPEVCASQWLQGRTAVEETLACIQDYVKNEH
jgi:hypothetical protein